MLIGGAASATSCGASAADALVALGGLVALVGGLALGSTGLVTGALAVCALTTTCRAVAVRGAEGAAACGAFSVVAEAAGAEALLAGGTRIAAVPLLTLAAGTLGA